MQHINAIPDVGEFWFYKMIKCLSNTHISLDEALILSSAFEFSDNTVKSLRVILLSNVAPIYLLHYYLILIATEIFQDIMQFKRFKIFRNLQNLLEVLDLLLSLRRAVRDCTSMNCAIIRHKDWLIDRFNPLRICISRCVTATFGSEFSQFYIHRQIQEGIRTCKAKRQNHQGLIHGGRRLRIWLSITERTWLINRRF